MRMVLVASSVVVDSGGGGSSHLNIDAAFERMRTKQTGNDAVMNTSFKRCY